MKKSPLPLFTCTALVAVVVGLTHGCVGLQHYNRTPAEYVRTIRDAETGTEADLCIIEFDDEGEFWDPRQLADTLLLINRRNVESPHGIVVPVFIHGWKNNADWKREHGALRRIANDLQASANQLAHPDNPRPRRVVGVFIGWRGDTLRGGWLDDITFWNRLLAADRVASSINVKETLTKIMLTAKQRPESRVIMYGHSMGGRILFTAMGTSLINMSVNEGEGRALPVDLVIMANPAVRAVDVARFVDMLKRHDVQLVTKEPGGKTIPADGPLIASISSNADAATKRAFPFGQSFVRLFRAYREDEHPGRPSQGWLAAHTDGHTGFLISHHASVVNGAVRIEPVPDRYNNTPYWVIQTSPDICRNHNDINNPRMTELIKLLLEMRHAYTATNWPHLIAGNPLGGALDAPGE